MRWFTSAQKHVTAATAVFGSGIGFGILSRDGTHCEESSTTTTPTIVRPTLSSTTTRYKTLRLFTGNANPKLAEEVALHIGVPLSACSVTPFADGEISVKVNDSVRGQDVYIIQPTCAPVNDSLMELLLMISTMRRASAKKITAVIPYFGYGRSTETFSAKRPIAASDVAIMLEVAGVDRVVAVDLHRGQTNGFFSPHIPTDDINGASLAIPYLQTKFLTNPVVVAPDANGTARAKEFADCMRKKGGFEKASFALVVESKTGVCDDELKFDPSAGSLPYVKSGKTYQLLGNVQDRDVVIVDDIIDSGTRMQRTATMLKEAGASRVFAFATHGLFTGDAIQKLQANPNILEVLVLNTIPLKAEDGKIKQLSIAAMLAEAIKRMHTKQSISDITK